MSSPKGMTPERFRRIREVFEQVLDLPPEERAAVLPGLCGPDAELHQEVMDLLTALDHEGRGLDQAAAVITLTEELRDEGPPPGQCIGPYRLLREVGRGGMGAVYEAVRADPEFERRVALKLIKRGMDSEVIVRRFRRERQILARLEHPNIAGFVDGGVTREGQPYFVMEFIDGQPIDRYCAERTLSIPERIRLFREVCEAVQYAHRNLVIHRDLKPGNLLVTAGGSVKLLDFGVAKVLREADTGDPATTLTRTGLRALTPVYASPEQLAGEPISTASDIYSLGVVLYELLTGTVPFDVPDLAPATIARVLESDPARPSEAATRETAITSGEGSVPKLRRRLAGDLDTIVLRAMHREPDRRYRSAEQLSEDLRRYLEGLPVLAQRDTVGYRIGKFVRRHRAAVAAAAVVFLALVGGIAATATQARRAEREARRAEAERAGAEQISGFLQKMISMSDPSWLAPGRRPGPTVTVAEALDGAARSVETELAGQPESEAAVRRSMGLAYRGLGLYDAAATQLNRTAALHRRLYQGAHPELARDALELGSLAYLTGQYDSAEVRYREALDLWRRLSLATTDTLYVTTLNNLAVLLWSRGRVEEAEPAIAEALDLNRRRFGSIHPTVAIALGNLGLIRDARGDLAGSEQYYRQALATFDRMPGREFFERAWSLINLAAALKLRGEYVESERLLRQSLEVWARTVGPGHVNEAQSRIHLAHLYFLRGEPKAGETEILHALDILGRAVPADHPDIAKAEAVYGPILTALGRPAEAERKLRHALRIRQGTLKAGDWRIAETKGNLGAALAAQRRYAEAKPLLLESHAELEAGLGAEHPRTRDAARRLADFYMGVGDGKEAQRYRQQAESGPRR